MGILLKENGIEFTYPKVRYNFGNLVKAALILGSNEFSCDVEMTQLMA